MTRKQLSGVGGRETVARLEERNAQEGEELEGPVGLANPVWAIAYALVERVLSNAAVRPRLATGLSAVVVEVDDDWLEPVVAAWQWLFPRALHEAEVRDVVPPLELRADKPLSKASLADQAAKISAALAVGRPVVGFSPDPERFFPPALLRVADLRVTVPRPDGMCLARGLELSFGLAPSALPAEEQLARVSIEDLLLARRPDRDPDAYLQRVIALTERQRCAPLHPQLEQLHGMQAAVHWGLALRTDLAALRRREIAWPDVDRGVLLAGPTGTGKTTFARALANSCGVPLVVGSLSEWQAAGTGHLGDMLKAMRECFAQARAAAPCILFIDEIDSLGNRASFHPRHRDYSTQVLNAMLELLDGVVGREGVVVVAATNRPEALDPALTRAGRLDRTITIDLPDADALDGIMRHHLGTDLADAKLGPIAQACVGVSGADVERAVRGARRRARHAGRPLVLADLQAELLGNGAEVPHTTRWRVAVHEAGHAVAAACWHPGTLRFVTVPRHTSSSGRLGLVTTETPCGTHSGDLHLTRDRLLRLIAQKLIGRAAEQVLIGDVSAGAGGSPASDIGSATWFATMAAASLGLAANDETSPIWLGYPSPETVPEVLLRDPALRQQVQALLDEANSLAVTFVRDRRNDIHRVARQLIDRDYLCGTDVEEILAVSDSTDLERKRT